MATIYSNTERPQRTSAPQQSSKSISIKGPLVFWVIFLVIAVIIQIIAVPLAQQYDFINTSNTLHNLAYYIMYIPGLLVFPFLVSLWIGERVGSRIDKSGNPMRIGFINAAYASVIYGITVFVLFLISNVGQALAFTQLSTVLTVIYLVFVPMPILLIMTPSFAYLAAARRASQ